MSPRTTPSQWAALFNFAGSGLVHMELFEALGMTATNPSLFEAIAGYLLLYGTHSLRPAAGDAPLNCLYFETDTTNLFQNQSNTWVQIASLSGGGSGPTIQINGVDADSQSILNFVDSGSVTWTDDTGGDIEAAAPGGSSWALAASFTWSTNLTNIVFTGLGAYSELLIVARNITLANAGYRNLEVSSDNGSTYHTTSGDYLGIANDGAESNLQFLSIQDGLTTAARTGIINIRCWNLTTIKPVHIENRKVDFGGASYVITPAAAMDAFRINGSNGGNITGGTVLVYGR